MKRKNLNLRNAFILIISTLVIVTVFNQLERKNYQSTIQQEYMDSVTVTLNKAEKFINENPDTHVLQFAPDVSVILIEEGTIKELNQELTSAGLSTFLQSFFVNSEDGQEFLDNRAPEPVYFSYQDDFNETYSFFSLKRRTKAGFILVSKNATAFEGYLHNKELLDFGLVMSLITIFFVLVLFLNKRVFTRISQMTELAYEFSENKFENSIELQSNDQIDNLGIALNKMGKTLEATSLINTQERKLLMHVYNSLDTGVLYVEEDFTITDLNTIGQRFFTSYIKNDEGRFGIDSYYESLIFEAWRTNEPIQVEIQHNQLIFDVRFIPVEIDEKLKTQGVLLITKDITTDKQLVSIREDLITNVSHDLRTPLATIQGYSETIKDDIAETTDEKNEMARIIHDEATQMSQMITSLLTVSRTKAGFSELNKESVLISAFFHKVINRFSERLNSEKIECDLVVKPGTSHYEMDEEKMHHAIYNLIDNAIHYAADPDLRYKRYIHIEVGLDELVDDLVITVSDNGIGISKESIPFIFERFFKDNKARTMPKNNGSGIGLSLVYTVITEHGGKIEVESTQNKGTSFVIRLPL